METDTPLSATERQAIERRLERGRLEEEARQARLAAQTNQRPRTNAVGSVIFIHAPCGKEFASKRSLGQHTRFCTAPPPPTLAERLLPPATEVISAKEIMEAVETIVDEVYDLATAEPVEGLRPAEPHAEPDLLVNKDGLTFPDYVASELSRLYAKRQHLAAQEEGIRKSISSVDVRIHELSTAIQIFSEVMKDGTTLDH